MLSATKVKEDPTGRFNIGESFQIQTPEVPVSIVTEAEAENPDTYCALCSVSVTSKPQMKLHLEGSKHAKKLKNSG